ncbi:hypothetical protein CUN61_11470 [Pseudomonas arsenicoxydans]|uniref:Uncharacterized protein n=1 Tax=Pseudomonas arsenicoxydans TaxID=702115 RepID=A0A4P6G534_9PSED|nr:hypothetical protein CUN61_11470 [Pseudomonas arsenicoxydans]
MGLGRGAQRYFSAAGRVRENTAGPCGREPARDSCVSGNRFVGCEGYREPVRGIAPWVGISITNNYRQLWRA